MNTKTIGIVGGGLIGLATAARVRQVLPEYHVQLWEKESALGLHQSTRNSGVLHAGLYYKPGSLKAQLAVQGLRLMTTFAQENNVRYELCGKIVVATDQSEIPRLQTLYNRGQANGLLGLKWLDADGIREREPHVAGLAAVLVPEEGIIDYAAVVNALGYQLASSGIEILTNESVSKMRKTNDGWVVETNKGTYQSSFLINCAGLYCDRVAQASGERPNVQIVPFRGEYFRLRPEKSHLIRNLVYPVPDPEYPFLGVHFTRMINGGVEAGPNAVLALAREGYSWGSINPRELAATLSNPGLWRFIARHSQMTIAEVTRSVRISMFAKALQKLVPEITKSDLSAGFSGVRAQAMTSEGHLVQDFSIIERSDAVHVLNAPSPGATASFAIGRYISDKVERQIRGYSKVTAKN